MLTGPDRRVFLRPDGILADHTDRRELHDGERLRFRAIWWATSQKTGVSALGLQRVLGLRSYKTAWAWLKLASRSIASVGCRNALDAPVTFVHSTGNIASRSAINSPEICRAYPLHTASDTAPHFAQASRFGKRGRTPPSSRRSIVADRLTRRLLPTTVSASVRSGKWASPRAKGVYAIEEKRTKFARGPCDRHITVSRAIGRAEAARQAARS